jgi:hypothetical protein
LVPGLLMLTPTEAFSNLTVEAITFSSVFPSYFIFIAWIEL